MPLLEPYTLAKSPSSISSGGIFDDSYGTLHDIVRDRQQFDDMVRGPQLRSAATFINECCELKHI